ncbi:MAG TPA: hypothetical protein VJP87_11855 [Candidatus Acidoferrales bacterium]|nr:hypothetical protein [Candidatus Acidoferrales bacterium]
MTAALPEKYTLDVASPSPIRSERQHQEYLSVLEELSGKIHLSPDEEDYAQVLLTLIESYEEERHRISDASPIQVLRALLEANNLRQKDLVSIFGSESIVSEILHRKRELNRSHIAKLSRRFGISPAAFF